MTLPNEITALPIVKQTVCTIRIMWDVRREKGFAGSVNWLDGMDEEYEKVLSMLFSTYAEGDETPKKFARRIAGV